MKLSELFYNIEVLENTAADDMEISGLAYDSRAIKPGAAFVAVEGYVTDGHKYIDSAVKNGAAVVVCQRKPEQDVPYVLVGDSRLALARLSAAYFGEPAKKLRIVGVTGTNGKTTITHLVKEIIEKVTGEKSGLIGTNENIVGDKVYEAERTTPESYDLHKLFKEMADCGCKYAVMEVSSHALVTGRIEGLRFEAGVFTNLTQDHLDFHKTMEEYRDAKAMLFDVSNLAVINLDDPAGPYLKDNAKCPVVTYSAKNDEADLVARDIKLKQSRVDFCAVRVGKIQRIELHIPGLFSVYNALAAIACCEGLGMALPDIAAALRECRGVKGRAEVVPTDTDYTVIIDYAHSPDALENILKTVRGFAKGRVVVVFGCGGERDKGKRPKMGRIAAELADFVIVSSDNPRSEDPEKIIEEVVEGMKDLKTPFRKITKRPEAVRYALSHAKPDDIIVLAGKGHEDYEVVGTKKIHQDEREIIADFFAKKIK